MLKRANHDPGHACPRTLCSLVYQVKRKLAAALAHLLITAKKEPKLSTLSVQREKARGKWIKDKASSSSRHGIFRNDPLHNVVVRMDGPPRSLPSAGTHRKSGSGDMTARASSPAATGSRPGTAGSSRGSPGAGLGGTGSKRGGGTRPRFQLMPWLNR